MPTCPLAMAPDRMEPLPSSSGPMDPEAMTRTPPAREPRTAPEPTVPEMIAGRTVAICPLWTDPEMGRVVPDARWKTPICPLAMLPDRTPPEPMCMDPRAPLATFPEVTEALASRPEVTAPLARWPPPICPLPRAPESRPPVRMWKVPIAPLATLPEVTEALPR